MLDKKIIQIPLLMVIFAFAGGCSQSENSNNIVYGDINFDNTGSSEAQAAFLTGVKSLHNFQFEDARIAFEEAAEIDSKFAMAYWGQAMSNNYPLWARQNTANAQSALNTLSPSLQGLK